MKPTKPLLILTACSAGLLVSCKKEETKPATPATPSSSSPTPAAPAASGDTFSNPEANKFLEEGKKVVADITEAIKNKDMTKVQPLIDKGKEWGAKATEMASKLTPEEGAKWAAKVQEVTKEYGAKVMEWGKAKAGSALRLVSGAAANVTASILSSGGTGQACAILSGAALTSGGAWRWASSMTSATASASAAQVLRRAPLIPATIA